MKKIIFFLILLLCANFVSSVEFDELVNSYDYSFNKDKLEITQINHVVFLDLVLFNVSINNSGGFHNYVFTLANQTRQYDYYCFDVCTQDVSINFSSNTLGRENNLSVKLYKDSELISQSNSLYSFNLTEQERASLSKKEFIILEDYSENDTLFLITNLSGFKQDYQTIKVYLSDEFQDYYFQNIIELNDSLTFNISLGHDSAYLIKRVIIGEDVFETNYLTRKYNFSKLKNITETIANQEIVISAYFDKDKNISVFVNDCYNDSLIKYVGVNSSITVSIDPYNSDNSSKCFPLNVMFLFDNSFYYYHQTRNYNQSDFETNPPNNKTSTVEQIVVSVKDSLKKAGMSLSTIIFKNTTNEINESASQPNRVSTEGLVGNMPETVFEKDDMSAEDTVTENTHLSDELTGSVIKNIDAQKNKKIAFLVLIGFSLILIFGFIYFYSEQKIEGVKKY